MTLFARTRIDADCTVATEATPDWLYAHVELDRVAVREGDEVLVQDAPVAAGAPLTVRRRAVVVRAGPLRRLWMRIASYWRIGELFEISFSIGRAP